MAEQSFALVYQCGIANVFKTGQDYPQRVLQGAFTECESFCRGLLQAGCVVSVYHADMAGDCSSLIHWARGAGDMLADGKNPPIRCRK